MWSWNQFRNLPKNQGLSVAEQARQYFIHQSNMMMEASSSAVAAASSAAGSGGGSSKKVLPNGEDPAFRLMFTDISFANTLVGDATNVNDWNTYLDLPVNGTPFTSVAVTGNEVALYGGNNITIIDNKFIALSGRPTIPYLISVIDEGGVIVQLDDVVFQSQSDLYLLDLPLLTSAGVRCFSGCTALTTINLPLLTIAGNQCFSGCTALTTINLPLLTNAGDSCFSYCTALTTINLPLLTNAGDSCFSYCTALTTINLLPSLTSVGDNCFVFCTLLTTVDLPGLINLGYACFNSCTALTEISIPLCTDLGSTVGNDFVFVNIIGNTISLTISASRMTCNGGLPDGDIQLLQANNTVTITQV